ncbi:related to spermine/spermidine synthase family protein [Rhynchosporium secalis]|uniref:Related to spermine/spermidine synthase family protein n=1 Tax=Rhynchosporium secalis TaxID=38038 RepID=A0A1E1M1W8_RHYSE|nr:related to spermine/spermidine synthase family protein [Rhynchosporium secalis]
MARPTGSKASATKSPKPQALPKETLFTQENFEKELKSLALKAQDETWGKWASEQAWTLALSGTLLALGAIYSNVSLLSLSPVYGGIPSSALHAKGIMAACFLGWSSNLHLKRLLPVKPQFLLPLIAAYIPMVQFFLFKISGRLGGIYGPIVTEALTSLPLLLLSVSCTATILDDLEMSPGRVQWLADAMPGMLSYSFLKGVEHVSMNSISRSIGASFLQTRLGLQILLTGLYSLFAPSKLLLYAIPALLHTALFNGHVQLPYTTSVLNSTLDRHNWTIIDRQESLTGYISILESYEQQFRVMRCDHSLLGGEWLVKSSRNSMPEPIYGVFVMLEAVRLVEVETPIPDSQAKAFVVGLGIGTTPAALMAHGISTTIVEIDPVVHDFATKYFALPKTHKKVIADAVSYAAEVARSDERYDYVVHDVFTGGAEPVDLFTYEFLSDLNTILKPGGVIAINYAGDLLLPSARIIVQTILSIFTTCRIFRESAPPPPSQIASDGRDFINMVIFCHKPLPFSSSNPAQALSFRAPIEKDFLGSKARQAYLLPIHEVDREVFEWKEGDGGVLRRNATERFRSWQETSARGHWAVMRTVVPEGIWENW